jgi:predicted nucleic acid-binding protein
LTLENFPYVVLDTNVVSILIREYAQADYYRAQIANRHLALSFQTLEELWHGAYHANWGEPRQDELSQQLRHYEIVWPNSRLVDICARLRAERKRAGRELSLADAWIAATALMLNCPLATDDRDFLGIPDLELIQAR